VTRDLIDDLAGLRPQERGRLEAFAELFDRLDARDYSTFAPVVEPGGLDLAREHANAAIATPERRIALRRAIDRFVDAAAQGYSRRLSLTNTFLLSQSLPDRAEDRARFARQVERAVVALVLWDEISDDDRMTLLGPWAASLLPQVEPTTNLG
jgi:hypothetical protein